MFIVSNEGYASIRMTQRNYFGGAYLGCDVESGLGFPRWDRIFAAYDIPCAAARPGAEATPEFQRAVRCSRAGGVHRAGRSGADVFPEDHEPRDRERLDGVRAAASHDAGSAADVAARVMPYLPPEASRAHERDRAPDGRDPAPRRRLLRLRLGQSGVRGRRHAHRRAAAPRRDRARREPAAHRQDRRLRGDARPAGVQADRRAVTSSRRWSRRPYALSKYVAAKDVVYSADEAQDTEFLFNMETITGVREPRVDHRARGRAPGADGVVFGRVDFVGSLHAQPRQHQRRRRHGAGHRRRRALRAPPASTSSSAAACRATRSRRCAAFARRT